MFGYGSQHDAAAAAALSSLGASAIRYTTGSNPQHSNFSSMVGSAYAQFGQAAVDAATAAAGYGVSGKSGNSLLNPPPPPPPGIPSNSANATPIGGLGSISSHYSGYEQAVYAAARSYVQAQKGGTTKQWMKPKKRPGLGLQFYCELCRISCAGSQAYKEHLEGKPHKRKETATNKGGAQPLPGVKTSYKCDACNVTCACKDSYDAHVKGAKHVRTITLMRKMNKPVPTTEQPTIIPGTGAMSKKASGSASPVKRVIGVAGTKFVGGTTLTSTGQIVTSEGEASPFATCTMEPNIKVVGEEFIEEQLDVYAKPKNYTCRLCQCSFTDPAAKNLHLKGRRHRLNYKIKVNPELEVEPKGNEKRFLKAPPPLSAFRGHMTAHPYPGMPPVDLMTLQQGLPLPLMRPPFPMGAYMGRGGYYAENEDDKHVKAKDEQIKPSKEETQAMEKLVNLVEKTLKVVSDKLVEESTEKNAERCMKGVMRVGMLAKGLVLKSDTEVNLVVLCSSIPTLSLLNKIAVLFSASVEKEDSVETMVVKEDQESSSLLITLPGMWLACRVTFTCVLLRDPAHGEDAKEKVDDALPSTHCLMALAELRRTKYYQVKCLPLPAMAITLRIIIDISRRVCTWRSLTAWSMELLVEKTLNSAPAPLSPGEAVRRLFEVIASGLLISKTFTLVDPCEKEALDALGHLSPQEREDITSSAEHALRLICFNQLHKILGIERITMALPACNDRKRTRESDEQNGGSQDGLATRESVWSPFFRHNTCLLTSNLTGKK